MEHIVRQTIPQIVINNPGADWDPIANTVKPAPRETIEDGGVARTLSSGAANASASTAREDDERYAHMRASYLAVREVDPHAPSAPTHIARRFDDDRELSEDHVRTMLTAVASSPVAREIGRLIQREVGRPLEPFDIWYNGFRAKSACADDELTRLTRQRYPNAKALEADLPTILERIGFAADRARWLAERIAVDPARGSGHAMGAGRRGDKPSQTTISVVPLKMSLPSTFP